MYSTSTEEEAAWLALAVPRPDMNKQHIKDE
jgi:hypothetical protein